MTKSRSMLVKGPCRLVGKINISGAKNAALPIMCAALLTDQKVIIKNIPSLLTDIQTMSDLLQNHGAKILLDKTSNQNIMTIEAANIDNFVAPYEIVGKMRASIWVLAPLLARFGNVQLSLPGGCAIGDRKIDLHIKVLEAMGAEIISEENHISAKIKIGKRLKAVNFTFNHISVGATINAIMAASLADGVTILNNCAREPEIIDLCHFIEKMGARIDGIGTETLKIQGQKELKGCEHKIIFDRIEAGTYMIAAAITKGDLEIINIDHNLMQSFISKLRQAGVEIEIKDNIIRVKSSGNILATDIETGVYPGIATDLQAQFMALMTIADNISFISENIFENRFMHVPELCHMGARIDIEGKRAKIYGQAKLKGAEVTASDLRASVSLILAALAAEGDTIVHNIHHLDRGYERLEEKFNSCGANMRRI